jgi:predicted RNase H-like nuclease
MLFVGIDLAWSDRNGTGIVVLKGNKSNAEFCSGKLLFSDREIADYIQKEIKTENAFIAVDAPLIVPNEEGRREAERLVGMLFRKYDAGAHPANRKRLSSWNGKIRGEDISKILEKNEFKHNPYIKRFEQTRKFFEVYPHPSMVVLFSLSKILQYKAKPKRNYNFRYIEFRKYQSYLKNLEHAKPGLILPDEIVKKDVKKLRAKALKNYEDLLDAVFCAYIAYYCWANPDKCMVLGDMKEGYILTPIFDFMKKQLESMNSQKDLAEFK